MKVSKTLLALSIAIALEGAWAQDPDIFEKDLEVSVGTVSVETASGRYVGVESNGGHYTIKMASDTSLTISGSATSLETPNRIYGITAQKESSLKVLGNVNINLDAGNTLAKAEAPELRAIRANGGLVDLEGDINVSLKAGGSYSSLLDAWSEKESGINIKGNITGVLESTSGNISAIKQGNDGKINISSGVVNLHVKSETGRIVGIENYASKGGLITIDSGALNIVTDNSNSSTYNQGILAYQSTTNINADTSIHVIGGAATAYGVDVQCDPNLPHDTIVNLNGSSTKVSVTGKKDAFALRPSGATGYINISSEDIVLSASSQDGLAAGTLSQYGASLKVDNQNAKLNISAQSVNGKAIAIYNTTYGGASTHQFGSTEIGANTVNLVAQGKDAFGIVSSVKEGDKVDVVNDKDGVTINADTIVNTLSNGGMSIGVTTSNKNNGSLPPQNKVTISNITVNSVAQNNGEAYAFYLKDGGHLEVGSASLTAVSEGGNDAVGIHNKDSTLIIKGDAVVRAEKALQGNGLVEVSSDASLIMDGEIHKDEWTGIINANGKVAYGVAESIAASDLANANDGTLLVIAGTEIAGNVNVGTVMTRDATAASHSLKVGSDGTILVRATDSYDGTSPLIKVDSVRAEKGSTVHLLNAAAVAEGTKVFESNDADEDSLEDYLFTTDNFLKKVENNRIVGEKSANVFGSDLLIPNVVDAAVNAANNEGADRILGLTNKALTQAQSLKAIHQIALIVPASGAQSTAINVANLQLDVIDTHASKLAFHAEDKVGADLWIDLNGFLSKTNDYSAGSAKFGYKSDLAGVTIGSDYSFGNGYAAGVSVAFGKGSVRGQGEGSGVKNDVDYYGVNLYGVWSNDYFNTIGSVGYLQTKNEIKTQGFKGKPDAKTVSFGVRFEKPLALNEAITVTPHLGVRYKHVKLDSFNAGGFKYTTEKADIVEMPFGVAFNANLKAPCGAEVKPFVDLTIAPNFGDRKVSNKIALAGTTASDTFDARIANNAMYNAKVGVNAVKGSHTFGLNYGIGGGNRGRVDQTLQARYTYRF